MSASAAQPGAGVDAVLTTTVVDDVVTTDDVVALRDALRGALGTTRQDLAPAVDADWRTSWPMLAELGLPALCAPEEKDGFGLRADAAVAAATELGAALHGGPFAGLTASVHALAHAADDPVADALLAGVLTGRRVCAFGRLGRDGRVGQNERVARLVDGVPGADALLLLDDSRDDLVLLLDPADWTADPSRHRFDITRTCADVMPVAGRGHRVAVPGDAARRAVALYELLLAADAVGGVRRMLDRTVAYAGQRQAFGRPIGGFQAVQHRLADHAVRARGMTLVVAEAARRFDDEPSQTRRDVALASVSVSSGAPRLLHDLLQLTGGIGFTWEYGLHFYERRAHQDARLAANPRAAQRSLADVEGWTDGR
ncbi:acyl-CoA dehydrogenase family protein [Pseudofrankia sp. BMG5.37]|uniref:acyl-CoA dehydrogenase family protein n=1 Tax=Pseudofrankia sp. BMG5.36 TaxID=1834512 RepID=UPI001F523286|nr:MULTISPECIES: acyl-CoA dehydrogenase family protein [unclassified Pseudofrankia]MDT3443203.1 acyl-CoA dehydrogenase family protein [Pseudofrankia sp. BMG5.37]